MNWLLSLIFDTSSFAHGFLVYSVIISLGICLGRKKIFGLSLGATCVLFVGLIVGYAGVKVDPGMMAFFRNFGLVLFVSLSDCRLVRLSLRRLRAADSS
jgi:putative transport protein